MFGSDDPQVIRTCDYVTGILPARPFSGAPYSKVTRIMVCMTPRSGSQYFGSILRDSGLGLAHEHFRYAGDQMKQIAGEFGLKTYEDFVRNRIDCNMATGSVFSVKNDWMQFLPLYYLGAYDHYFKDAHYIYLTRRNKLDQAVSRYIATESKYFHTTYAHKKEAVAAVEFSYDGIAFHLKHLETMELAWENFFLTERLTPLRIFYEQLATDPAEVVKCVHAYLGMEEPVFLNTHTEYRKVGTEKNQDFANQFLAEREQRRQAFIEAHQKEKDG